MHRRQNGVLVNLTPHEVNIGDLSIPVFGTAPRVTVEYNEWGTFNGIPLLVGSRGEVADLPAPQSGVLLIVSYQVRVAFPERTDLASPAQMVRDENGVIIGCRSLEINHS